ncbi:prolyl oligopeptidase family serine peptidase [Filimonas lacunae]|nr:prolyl oligopeptidase family serine peptidase [Filimonas lacunae]
MIQQTNAQLQYPATKKSEQSDDYFGTKVNDPYRWLEDDNSDLTKQWVKEQNTVTNDYLSKIPFRNQVKQRLEALWNYPKYSSPFKKGKYYYFYKNNGLQNQSVLYRQEGLNGVQELFLDPNSLSADGTAALGALSFSKNGKYMAYTVAQSGSDWQTGYIMNTETRQLLTEKIEYIKFSSFAWKGDGGFFYSRYPKPDEKSMLSKQNQFQKVYYHKIGTPQSKDILVFEDNEHPLRYFGAGVTEDDRYLFIQVSEGTSGGEVLFTDLWQAKALEASRDNAPAADATSSYGGAKKAPASKGALKFTVLIEGFDTEPDVIDNSVNKILVKTNDGAPNFKVVLIDPADNRKENWKTVIPEKPEALQSVSTGGGYLFASYLKDAATKVYQYSYGGKLVREITLPGIGTASGFGGELSDKDFFYTFTSFNYPPTIFRYEISTGTSEVFRKTEAKFVPENFETKQVFVTSKDGAKVPVFLTYKKGLQLDGNNPVLLYGYGGFNIAMTPAFSISNVFFMEQGGVYAQVCLRGGSEYGESWHKAGMLQNKQNVFNDLIASAEWLIENKYTNKEKIAVRGGSNGGLLVGAVMTQRPDLFKVAIPQVGVMDMLRFHKFTVGWGWAVEYGNAEKNADDFKNLYGYSPLHNLKKGICYPATLVTTADHDDRVVPAHSFKFAATLQESQGCANPTLIRIDSKAGHGAGKPTSKQIDEATDIWSFVMYNLGMTFKQQ